MPKVYLTAEERKQADYEAKTRQEYKLLMSDLRESKKENGLDYREIARRAGVSCVTVCKAFNEPGGLQVDMLRRICFAAGLKLNVVAEGG